MQLKRMNEYWPGTMAELMWYLNRCRNTQASTQTPGAVMQIEVTFHLDLRVPPHTAPIFPSQRSSSASTSSEPRILAACALLRPFHLGPCLTSADTFHIKSV